MHRMLTSTSAPVRGRKKPRTFTVENKTHLRTLDIKAIIARVRGIQKDRRPQQWIVSYSSKGHRAKFPTWKHVPRQTTSGKIVKDTVPNTTATLYLPRRGEVQPVQIAIAVYEAIEFGSYTGPTDDIRRRVELNQQFAWADNLPLRAKPPKPKPTGDQKRDERRQRTVAAIGRWETKEKRAKTALKKLRQKLRRIDKAAEKAGN